MSEEQEKILRKIESGKCTPSEIFNAKMYFGLLAVGQEGSKKIIAGWEQIQKKISN